MRLRTQICSLGILLFAISVLLVWTYSDSLVHKPEESFTGKDDVQLREMWLPRMVAATAKLGISLRLPPESSKLNKVNVFRERILGTEDFQICASCNDWSIDIEEKTQRIVRYYDGKLTSQINNEYQQLIEKGNQFDEKEYNKPRITVEQAKNVLEAAGLPASLGWDFQSLGISEPAISFIPSPSARGWQFEYRRKYRGYPIWNDHIQIIVNDFTSKIPSCFVGISSAIPPEPDIRIKATELEGIIDSILSNPPTGGRFSLQGCTKRPNTFAMKGLGYTRANQIWQRYCQILWIGGNQAASFLSPSTN